MKREDFLKKLQQDERVEKIKYWRKSYCVELKEKWYSPTWDKFVKSSFYRMTTMAEVETFLDNAVKIVKNFEEVSKIHFQQKELKYKLKNRICRLGALEIEKTW